MPRISAQSDDATEIEVDLTDPDNDIDGIEFEILGDEIVQIEPALPQTLSPNMAFGVNLAEHLEQSYLTKLAADIIEKVERDVEDRQPWVDRFTSGMAMLGLIEDAIDDGPFPGSSTAILPLLSEAQVQFWSRALPELFPSEGPAKCKVLGQATADKAARSERIKDFMNYEMTVLDRSYFAETSRLVAAIPFQGCAFRKTYRDPILKRTLGVFVPAEDLIVPATATDLHSAPHYTHRIFRTPNELRKLQVSGVYRDVELASPISSDDDEIRDIKAESVDVDISSGEIEQPNYELFETYIELDLPGYEDTYPDDPDRPSGIALPYVVTIDKSSSTVLSIYRNWRVSDPDKLRRVFFTKYPYLPGHGFYDYGLFHMLGGLQEAATGALRSLLDGAAFASLQGGFVAKDANIKDERLVVEPGVWKPIESTADEFNKAFLTPPYKEPSPALFQLLGILTQAAQRFTSTTEAMVGDAQNNAPVGTTLALIEQGSKVYSSIHRGLHSACAEELATRKELASENIPEGGYPYDPDNNPRTIYAEDFAPGVQVVPVSDPNIFSTTQRIQIAGAVLQQADSHPDLLDRKVAMRRYLEAIKVPDVDELMSVSTDPQPMDPVSENQSVLRQKPIKAFPDQDHMAHIQVHMAFMQSPGFGGHPQVGTVIGPAMQAHIGEHLAYLYATHMRMAGVPAPMLDPVTGQPTQPMIPPEHLAAMAAQVAGMVSQAPGLPPPPDQQQEQAAPAGRDPMLEAQGQMALTQAKIEAVQATTQAKLEAQAVTTQAKLQAQAAETEIKLSAKQREADAKAADREHKMAVDQIDRITSAMDRRTAADEKVHTAKIDAASREHTAGVEASSRAAKAADDARRASEAPATPPTPKSPKRRK